MPEHLWPCKKWVLSAERELGAFFASVADSYGLDEAVLAAEDWLEELRKLEVQHQATGPDWRNVTIAAAIRLASRLNVQNTRSRCA